jgi:hypothetical protein
VKKFKKSDLSGVEQLSLIQACRDVAGGPWPGVPYGTGRQITAPPEPTEEQMVDATSVAETIGWTFHGPNGGAPEYLLPASLCDDINGEVGDEKVRNASVLAHARNAIRKGIPA